jgi:hypothetical protein
MLAFLFILLTSCAAGSLILRLSRLHLVRRLERITLSLTVGMGVWCLTLFTLGHMGLLHRWLFFLIGGAAVLVEVVIVLRQLNMSILLRGGETGGPQRHRDCLEGSPEVKVHRSRLTNLLLLFSYLIAGLKLLRTKRLMPFRQAIPCLSIFEWALACGTAIIVLITFIACFAPVTGGIKNDEICTHLSVPARWLCTANFAPVPEPGSSMAWNGELLFLLTESISPESGPRLVSWIAFALCIAAVYCLSRGIGSRSAVLAAAAIVAMNPLLFRGAPIAFVDTLSALYVIVPLWLLFFYRKSGGVPVLVIAAFCLGIGCGIKPTNFIYSFFAVGFAFVIIATEKTSFAIRLRKVLIVSAVTVIAALPWPTRTWLLTGSPTFPPPPALGLHKPLLADRVPYTKEYVAWFYSYVNSRYGDYHRSPVKLAAFPWDVTMRPERFQIGDAIGTLMLCLLPLALVMALVGRRRSQLALLGYALAASAAVYAVVLPEARYFIPAYCALAPPLAFSVFGQGAWRTAGVASRSVLIINLLFGIAVAIQIGKAPLRAALDKQYARATITANRPFAEAFEFLATQKEPPLVVLRYDQNYYGAHRDFTFDSLALSHPEQYRGALLLDIDNSQSLERDVKNLRHEFAVADSVPSYLEKVFEGPDARVYKFR